MKNDDSQENVIISDLLPFMNKKFFNYVIYYLPKSIVVTNHEVVYKENMPYACLINFEDKDSKEKFIDKFTGENYPNLSM